MAAPSILYQPAPFMPVIYDPDTLSLRVWDGVLEAGSLVIGAVTQSGAWTFGASSLPLPAGAATQATLAAIDASTAKLQLTAVSGSVNGVGNNTLVTPSAGKKIRLSYASYNPALAVEAAFRFGATGALFLRNSLTAGGGVLAKDFGDMRYVEGAVDEPVILNLSLGVATIWNALYVEV